ncbi:ABC transporter permease [Acidithiobacillus sp. CV18-2]|uniref:ABC transporter permease n=2 Tax=Igneacidithiobacillus copahuensis TaxID=2724909 RepID=A0AAE2YN37_9PROT|nr:ABC transporter permease [Acidithiobacillus sp. CV18-3]MBU2757264.1 ABC transporter permease [Acidithiobacillus sp. BN09-2]MBU2776833.1 ABC transporter permease [Acidithiobacillus sp. CV18-2]MBU2787187.1 ABC transporter permease [Igneacidithiobacillus copahuensis]MBU2796419.1 ABC transporter permease [Acidithiobacillus sp. VAN18-2]MBU2799437.1 ABC transporter permease [Acidithiobacillus sp. VAN18-4]
MMPNELRHHPILQAIVDQGVLIAFVLLVVFLAFVAPHFVSTANAFSILIDAAPLVLLALCELVVMLVAGIDLAVGAIAGFTGAIAATMMLQGFPWPIATLLALLAAMLAGTLQGVIINYLRVTDFITTLAGLSIFSSLTLIITDGEPMNINANGFNALGEGHLLGVPTQIWIAAFIVLVVALWLGLTASGMHLYAIGGNRVAAYRAGIRVRRLRSFAYAFSGLSAGIAGVILAAQLATADPNAGRGQELPAIAAVVIGGVSLFGGRGSVWGAVLGALILSTILDGLVLLNISPFFTELVEGVVILLAVMMGHLRKRSSN